MICSRLLHFLIVITTLKNYKAPKHTQCHLANRIQIYTYYTNALLPPLYIHINISQLNHMRIHYEQHNIHWYTFYSQVIYQKLILQTNTSAT